MQRLDSLPGPKLYLGRLPGGVVLPQGWHWVYPDSATGGLRPNAFRLRSDQVPRTAYGAQVALLDLPPSAFSDTDVFLRSLRQALGGRGEVWALQAWADWQPHLALQGWRTHTVDSCCPTGYTWLRARP